MTVIKAFNHQNIVHITPNTIAFCLDAQAIIGEIKTRQIGQSSVQGDAIHGFTLGIHRFRQSNVVWIQWTDSKVVAVVAVVVVVLVD